MEMGQFLFAFRNTLPNSPDFCLKDSHATTVWKILVNSTEMQMSLKILIENELKTV